MKANRRICVAVDLTGEPWELVRTFCIPFEGGIDLGWPVVARALALLAEHGRELTSRPNPTSRRHRSITSSTSRTGRAG